MWLSMSAPIGGCKGGELAPRSALKRGAWTRRLLSSGRYTAVSHSLDLMPSFLSHALERKRRHAHGHRNRSAVLALERVFAIEIDCIEFGFGQRTELFLFIAYSGEQLAFLEDHVQLLVAVAILADVGAQHSLRRIRVFDDGVRIDADLLQLGPSARVARIFLH